MSEEFKVISSQEELDRVIGGRIASAKAKAEEEAKEKYAGYDQMVTDIESYKTQIAEMTTKLEGVVEKDTRISDLEQKVAKYEADSVKTRIAIELGIPYQMAGRLNGTNEDEIRKDAENIKSMFAYTPPLRDSESKDVDGVTAAFKKKNPNIKL